MTWHKTSRHKRGYGVDWDKQRERILRRDSGICQPCLKDGRIHTATEVDHIVSKAKAKKLGWSDAQINADSNLQAINRDCHKKKTTEENGKQLKPQIGLDGWPIER